MKDFWLFILLIIVMLGIAAVGLLMLRDGLDQAEKIEMLETSLHEQIQEKEVYMHMLEEREGSNVN